MNGEERLFGIALSILGIKVQREFYTSLSSCTSREFYQYLPDHKKKVQPHISEVYGEHALSCAEQILENVLKKKLKLILYGEEGYPFVLTQIDDPPLALYVTGTIPHAPAVGIVGTRQADIHSTSTARRLSRALSEGGACVVSGMAAGIDRAAHEGALDVGGATVGVLAGGVDTIYPRSNSDLYLEMLKGKNTLLLSEFPPGVQVKKWAFVKRNRLISGLSAGVVVVKAAEKSGALITADFALQQNREVFACCGPTFDEGYAGCFRLINEGAWCVQSEQTIMDVLKMGKPSDRTTQTCGPWGERVMEVVRGGIHEIDEICRHLDMDMSKLNQIITELELAQTLMRSGNRLYMH